MSTQIKTTKDINKAIRFMDADKAFGASIYIQAANIADKTSDQYITDIEDHFAEDIKQTVWMVVYIDTNTDETRYLMHPCADEFAHINLHTDTLCPDCGNDYSPEPTCRCGW